jgi:hypothetical protein
VAAERHVSIAHASMLTEAERQQHREALRASLGVRARFDSRKAPAIPAPPSVPRELLAPPEAR